MATEKAGINHSSTDTADRHDLQNVETNDDIAPEIIGMFVPTVTRNGR